MLRCSAAMVICVFLTGCSRPPADESSVGMVEPAGADPGETEAVQPAVESPPASDSERAASADVEGEQAEPRVAPPEDERLMRAWGLIGQRRYTEAESLLGEVLAAYPETAQATFFLGVSYQKQKDYVRARAEFERVIASGATFERSEVVYYFYGWGLYWLGELEASREAFETFKRADSTEADVWFALGLIDYDEDRLDAAEANFRHALSLHDAMAKADPQRYRTRLQAVAKCHGRLADVYIRRDELEAARDELQIAIEMWPRHHQPYYKLYRVLTRLGDERGAARALEIYQRRLREQGMTGGDG